ncbi:MAG: Gfo/Idh/MocA family oxidoreductase [Chloroflexota bacterium]|nr:MAG: Gfo/Idh/MocA family oxidoreductase [Chloroflexota bacterium]
MPNSTKIRVGLVGLSSDHIWAMGDGLAAQPEVEIVTAAESYEELCEQVTARWNLTSTYPDATSMFAAEQVDAILICGDNASKADIVEAAAARKIHVYSDKPMAATLAQANRIVKAVESSGITYMCAYHSAYNPTFDQVKALIDAGAIGKVYLARGVTGHGGPKEFGCSDYFCEWLFDKKRNGGGTFIDEACYLLNNFVHYFGEIAEISAFTSQMGHRDYLPPDVEDNSVAILRFKNGALGMIDSKWGQVGPAPLRSSFHGSAGTITSGANGTELFSTASPTVPSTWAPIDMTARVGHGRMPEGLKGWCAPDVPRSQTGSNGPEQRHFVNCVLAGKPVTGAASPGTARSVQEAIEAVYRAAESSQVVHLPIG